MRAVLIKDDKGPVENLYIGEAPLPSLRSLEVLVKIKAFGVNRMDLSQREGKYPVPPGASSVLGVEFSGIIADIGTDVSGWKVGEEVLGHAGGGAYAEFIAVSQTHVIKKPTHLSWVEAASIPEVFLTAFQALVVIGCVKKGDNVLIHAGASGVGVAAIQLARIYGANTVTATTSTQDKINWLFGLANGPTNVVNYKTEDFAAEIKKITNNVGANVIIDFVGQSHWNRNIECMALDGRMTMLALLSGGIVDSVNLAPLLSKRLHIEGSTLRSRTLQYQADLISRFEAEVFQKITGENGDGAVKTYIHQVFPWTGIQDAHRALAANENSGKIVVEVV